MRRRILDGWLEAHPNLREYDLRRVHLSVAPGFRHQLHVRAQASLLQQFLKRAANLIILMANEFIEDRWQGDIRVAPADFSNRLDIQLAWSAVLHQRKALASQGRQPSGARQQLEVNGWNERGGARAEHPDLEPVA